MIKHKQIYRHLPKEGERGDCARTVIACLLDLHPLQVPHFTRDAIEGGNEQDAVAAMDLWVRANGHTFVEFPVQANSPEDALNWAGSYSKNTLDWLLSIRYQRVG